MKYSVNFSVKSGARKTLRARVSFNALRVELYTPIIADERWRPQQQQFPPRDKRNLELNRMRDVIDDIFSTFWLLNKRYPTKSEFIAEYHVKTGKTPEVKTEANTFIKAIDLYIENNSRLHQWSKENHDRFGKLRNHWENFKPWLTLEEITENDLIELVHYFQTAPINSRTGEPTSPHKNTTVARTMKDVRSVLRWANGKGLYTGALHQTFYPKFKGAGYDLNEPIYLSWDELMKFYHHQFTPEEAHLETTRDIIAFCCFTSLRYSDAQKLRKNWVTGDAIRLVAKKTTEAAVIDLNDYSRAILAKYRDNEVFALPRKTMQVANEQIKKIGEILEFNQPINYVYFVGERRYDTPMLKYQLLSTHVGRKTFIVNALYLGIPAEVIMKWTGHADYQSMKPYIAIVDELKNKEMQRFNRAAPKNSPDF